MPALVALQERVDRHWFGQPEHDEAQVRESFDRVAPLALRSRLWFDDGLLAAAAWWWREDETTVLVDPRADAPAVYDDLLPWLADSGATDVEALRQDVVFLTVLQQHGWQPIGSQFELVRDTSPLPSPRWPDAVTTTGLGDHALAVYRVIYDEAGWAQIPGHGHRGAEEWHSLFLAGEDPGQQVLAWSGGRLVGVALGTTFSDGMGWVSQVAVTPDRQGQGLGSALLVEALRRRLAVGARRLGLGVSAANDDALRLYQRLGFDVDREWVRHRLDPRRSPASARSGAGNQPAHDDAEEHERAAEDGLAEQRRAEDD